MSGGNGPTPILFYQFSDNILKEPDRYPTAESFSLPHPKDALRRVGQSFSL